MADPKKVAGGVVNFGVIAAFTAFASFPFAWMLITTFKQTRDLLDPSHNPFVYHSPPTLEHLRVLFEDTLFLHWVGNTLFVGVVVVLITLLLAVPAGYSLARLTGAAGEKLGIGIFLTYLVPPTILFIPLSRLVASLGLQDSLWALVLVYPSFTVPFCTWLLMGFFKVIPKDVEEAAMIDGHSRFGAFLRVILPMSVAGLLTTVIFSLHPGDAGVRLRPDLHHHQQEPDPQRRASPPSWCAATCTSGARSWPRASSPRCRSPSSTTCSSTGSSPGSPWGQ